MHDKKITVVQVSHVWNYFEFEFWISTQYLMYLVNLGWIHIILKI